MATPAGERNHLITIQYRASETTDDHGHKTPNWATRCTAWAKQDQLSSSESLEASKLTAIRTTAWLFPFTAGISVTDQVVYDGRTMQITAVTNPDGRREDTRLVCTEVMG